MLHGLTLKFSVHHWATFQRCQVELKSSSNGTVNSTLKDCHLLSLTENPIDSGPIINLNIRIKDFHYSV